MKIQTSLPGIKRNIVGTLSNKGRRGLMNHLIYMHNNMSGRASADIEDLHYFWKYASQNEIEPYKVLHILEYWYGDNLNENLFEPILYSSPYSVHETEHCEKVPSSNCNICEGESEGDSTFVSNLKGLLL